MPDTELEGTDGPISAIVLDRLDPRLRTLLGGNIRPGWNISFAPDLSGNEAERALAAADVLFTANVTVDKGLLARCRGLRLLVKLAAGVDGLDLQECHRRGIDVARVRAGNAFPVAEHTIMLILAALRRLPFLHQSVRQGEWRKEEARATHRELRGSRVGLVGLGAVGQRMAELLVPFGAHVAYFSRSRLEPADEARLQVTYLSLEDLVARSDIVSLHLPLTQRTERLFDARMIAMMRPGGILVNCSRGRLVDEQALAAALREGRLAAAGLDTFALEPPLGSPLLELGNVVLSPHIAGATREAFQHVFGRALDIGDGYFRTGTLSEHDRVDLSEA